MKVKDLKKILEKYPDNLEIKIHNGFVDDWQDFKVDETFLERYSKSSMEITREVYNKKHNKNLELKEFKNNWEYPNIFMSNEDRKKRMIFKNILLIQPKRKGVTSYDRLGKMSY